ncbi:uncharacterized protein At4g13230-like [Ananas comosus]|uniref:Uncharacterized protein At4g13230-like n=2 Tax=Ananas comosus TaxID=4615 RepID=A0A6P5EE68_ANACO|nr:uncharacterized protein At4g13230-like [Ananas comosus]CAD1820907.1 unnamed protein product [Ananas comosus var. bracteatus]
MASMRLTWALPKCFLRVGPLAAQGSPRSVRLVVTSTQKTFQSPGGEDAEKPMTETMGDQLKKTAEDARGIASTAASQASETAQDLGDRAKQVAQDAWDSAKGTAQKIKDTVVGSAEETGESIKENAKTVKRAMNTKNR